MYWVCGITVPGGGVAAVPTNWNDRMRPGKADMVLLKRERQDGRGGEPYLLGISPGGHIDYFVVPKEGTKEDVGLSEFATTSQNRTSNTIVSSS
jgi:hypothetical protein